ncbi:hypothetical protein CVT25_014339 [Psilocybe cyanescens]|uniref:Ras-domain-containing protein n=1 Tax=Psilocybe cyanescens TaxID=93625 RepID=A0A409WU85_PSICY|nr:hypothetical protein CVT25_014339 [Psilocybe cyanescens]
MPTVKLVVIGSSGVGKTSIRGKYISGRFSNGYRATIGADFITKTLPHPTQPDQSVTLQIWDTAGQERFSSLSTAFFRGADAALLMFDVNAPETMVAMKKWWADFCDRAPVANDVDMNDYCCVVVGNKIDMVGKGSGEGIVSESEALEFLDELIPPSDISILPPSISNGSPQFPTPSSNSHLSPTQSSTNLSARSPSIAIAPQPHPRENSHSPKHQLTKSRSRSSSRFYSGTMTTTHTTLTIYHTPSSSYYQSARSSPEPWSSFNSNSSASEPDTISPTGSVRRRSMTILSSNSTSSGSAPTITPSLYARENAAGISTPSVSPLIPSSSPIPPERGPKLFFTSAKTGDGVSDVFEYIAQRVVRRWEYEEWVEARTMHFREASAVTDTIRLGAERKKNKTWGECCT